MGIQSMHNDSSFLLNQLWGLDCCGRFLSMGLLGLQLPILHKGCSYVFPKCPLTRKEYNKRNTESNPLYPSSCKPSDLSPTCSTTRCQKNYLMRPQSEEPRNKKQEEKRNLNRNYWNGNLLILEMGLGRTSPPPDGEGG